MNEMVNQLAQSLFKKNSLQECSRWELEILADKYPYFGIAQFMLAGKLKEENDEAYKKQVQKTSLYFSNPLWLDYTLKNNLNQDPEPIIVKEPERDRATTNFEERKTGPDEVIAFVPDDPVSLQKEKEEAMATETDFTEAAVNSTLPKKEPATDEAMVVAPDEPASGTEAEINTIAGEIKPVTDEAAVIAPDDPVPGEMETEASMPTEAAFAEKGEEEINIAPLKMEPAPDENAALEFQAFHTVDYFASQGIKLKTEDVPKDRFDRQLKSFTEWLKTLKKVPASEITKGIDKGSEQKVITLAEHSVENREIVTETMAEVWVKQGNRAKALEVYNKLSLQNPAKSSYFASLIEQLKNQ